MMSAVARPSTDLRTSTPETAASTRIVVSADARRAGCAHSEFGVLWKVSETRYIQGGTEEALRNKRHGS